LDIEHVEKYHEYCRHCDVLYRRVLEPLGYEYAIDLTECNEAKCAISVKKKAEESES
jgi:hypothetical protein